MKEEENFSVEKGDPAQPVAPITKERYEDGNFVDTSNPVWNYSVLYDDDVANFQNGTHYSLYKKFGSKKNDSPG